MPTPQTAKFGKAAHAFRWSVAGAIARRALSLVGLGVLARIFAEDKEALGAWRELTSLHLVVAALLPLGFDILLIRESARRDEYLKALRGALIATALFCAAALWFGRNLLAERLGIDDYVWLFHLAPLCVLFQASKLSIKSNFAAQLDFRRISVGETMQTAVMLLPAAALALVWPTAGVLYGIYVLSEGVEAAWLLGGVRRIVRDARENMRGAWSAFLSAIRRQWRFVFLMTGDVTLSQLSANAPFFLLGGAIGPGAVAAFAIANGLATTPSILLIQSINRIVLPDLAGRDEADLHRRTLLLIRACAAWISPLLIALGAVAPWAVWIVAGKDYIEAASPMLRWLAVAMVFNAVVSPLSQLDILRDKAHIGFIWNIISLAARTAGVLIGARIGAANADSGATTAVAGLVIAILITYAMLAAMEAWLLGAGFARFFLAWLRFVPGWIALAAMLYGIIYVTNENYWLALALFPIPLALYALLVRALDPEVWQIVRRLARI